VDTHANAPGFQVGVTLDLHDFPPIHGANPVLERQTPTVVLLTVRPLVGTLKTHNPDGIGGRVP
jgi:hypothetical protein